MSESNRSRWAGRVIATNPSSNLHLKSGVAPIAEAIKRGCRFAIRVDASAFDEDDDILRELRLGHFLHGGWGFDAVVARGEWLARTVANGRFANGAPGDGAIRVGAPADILALDLDHSIAIGSCPSSRSISSSLARRRRMWRGSSLQEKRSSATAARPASISRRPRRR